MVRQFHPEDASSMTAGVFHTRMAVERGRIATIRQAMKEDVGATKNKFARKEVGEEEVCHTLHET